MHEYSAWHWHTNQKARRHRPTKNKMDRPTASSILSFHRTGPRCPASVYVHLDDGDDYGNGDGDDGDDDDYGDGDGDDDYYGDDVMVVKMMVRMMMMVMMMVVMMMTMMMMMMTTTTTTTTNIPVKWFGVRAQIGTCYLPIR
jgi:hypothetical protein